MHDEYTQTNSNIQITMEMFFRDMRCATLDLPRRQLRFKIDHPLCHYSRDYSHEDPSHFVVIQFSSGVDAERVTQKVHLPATIGMVPTSFFSSSVSVTR